MLFQAVRNERRGLAVGSLIPDPKVTGSTPGCEKNTRVAQMKCAVNSIRLCIKSERLMVIAL